MNLVYCSHCQKRFDLPDTEFIKMLNDGTNYVCPICVQKEKEDYMKLHNELTGQTEKNVLQKIMNICKERLEQL